MSSILTDESVPLDVICVDDGSEDDSVAVLETFGDAIQIVRQNHRGANAARNAGLALARGEYVRFLDSDDYLQPNITARQLESLSSSGADIVYGDWYDLRQRSDGTFQESVRKSVGETTDMVELLLGDRWCPLFCYLMRREVADAVRWDESLLVCQDFDFFLRIALAGYRFAYSPVIIGTFNQHSDQRLSQQNRAEWCRAKKTILFSAIANLNGSNGWTPSRRDAVAQSLLGLAKICYGRDRALFRQCLEMLGEVAPDFQPPGHLYRKLVSAFGYETVESILEIRRKVRGMAGSAQD